MNVTVTFNFDSFSSYWPGKLNDIFYINMQISKTIEIKKDQPCVTTYKMFGTFLS